MRMLEAVVSAWELLSVLTGSLGSLCSSLAWLLCWLRAALVFPGTRSTQQQHVREGPREVQAEDEDGQVPTTPLSVNYHFTRQCNYRCGFCFHTAKTSYVLPLEEAKRGLRMLKEAGESRLWKTHGPQRRRTVGLDSSSRSVNCHSHVGELCLAWGQQGSPHPHPPVPNTSR